MKYKLFLILVVFLFVLLGSFQSSVQAIDWVSGKPPASVVAQQAEQDVSTREWKVHTYPSMGFDQVTAVWPTVDGYVMAAGEQAGNGVIRWCKPTGGYFPLAADLGCAPQDLVMADIDGDEDDDVIVASWCMEYGAFWFENNGANPNNDWTRRDLNDQDDLDVWAIHVIDLDKDDDLDVLGAGWGGTFWWENDGTPRDDTFWVRHEIDTGYNSPNTVYAGDIDGDGDVDVLGEGAEDVVTWWQNDGSPADGGWSAYIIAEDFDGLSDVVVAYLDSDSFLDVIGAARTDDRVTWWQNDGSPTVGVWLAHNLNENLDMPLNVALGDLDGDNDLDLATAGGSSIVWNEYQEPSVTPWIGHLIAAVPGSPGDLAIYDPDGDGDNDVVAGFDDGQLLWWENRLILQPPWFRRHADYDSGWINRGVDSTQVFEHNLLGNVDDYVVRLEFLDTTVGGEKSSVNQYNFGGDWYGAASEGGDWRALDGTGITIRRNAQDTAAERMRVRIWSEPRPDFDSGWQDIDPNTSIEIIHALGGNSDDYVVDMQFKDIDGTNGVHQIAYGGDLADSEHVGSWWEQLTASSIFVSRSAQDPYSDQVRVRIWRDTLPDYDSTWQSVDTNTVKTFEHNLGSFMDDFVVDLQFKSNASLGVNHYSYGGDFSGTIESWRGAWWEWLTSSKISVTRASGDENVAEARVRIWRIAPRQWDSGWQSGEVVQQYDLGGDPERYLVYMWFRDTNGAVPGIHQIGYGLDNWDEGGTNRTTGAAWYLGRDSNQIYPQIGADDIDIDEWRIRIFEAPPPLYDSDWLTLAEEEYETWAHNLGYQPYNTTNSIDDYLVNMIFRSGAGTISQIGYGLDSYGARGASWQNLSELDITTYRYPDIYTANGRIRIWMDNSHDYDSWWQAFPGGENSMVLNHDVGGEPDNYIVDLQFWDSGMGSREINHTHYGQDRLDTITAYGVSWQELTESSIKIWRWLDLAAADYGRIRIWNVPGPLDHIIIRDASNGGGDVVEDRLMNVGESISLYAAGYDANGNFLGDQWVNWSTTGSLDSQSDTGLSFTFIPVTGDTSGLITANNGLEDGGLSDSTGTITVNEDPVVGRPRILLDEAHDNQLSLDETRAREIEANTPWNDDWTWFYLGQLEAELSSDFQFERDPSNPLTLRQLVNYDALLVPHYADALTSSEISIVRQFVAGGGGLILLGDCGFVSPNPDLPQSYGIEFDAACLFAPYDSVDGLNGDLEIANFDFAHPAALGVDTFMQNWGQSLNIISPAYQLADTWDETREAWKDENGNDQYDEGEEGVFTIVSTINTDCGRVAAVADNTFGDGPLETWPENVALLRALLEWVTDGTACIINADHNVFLPIITR